MPRYIVGESFRHQGENYLAGTIFTHDDPLPEGVAKFLVGAGSAVLPAGEEQDFQGLREANQQLQEENRQLKESLDSANRDLQAVGDANQRNAGDLAAAQGKLLELQQQLDQAREELAARPPAADPADTKSTAKGGKK